MLALTLLTVIILTNDLLGHRNRPAFGHTGLDPNP